MVNEIILLLNHPVLNANPNTWFKKWKNLFPKINEKRFKNVDHPSDDGLQLYGILKHRKSNGKYWWLTVLFNEDIYFHESDRLAWIKLLWLRRNVIRMLNFKQPR
jgi:hypothetical protein